jgi:hypothetical protein
MSLSGCTDGESDPSTGSETHWLSCSTDSDCSSTQTCVDQRCTPPEAAADYCGDLESIAPSSAVAASPRTETGLEQLTLALDDSAVASQTSYEQVVQDVETIKAQFPAVADISYQPRESTGIFIEVVSKAVTTQMSDGNYTAWDCLNEHFGPAEVSTISDTAVFVTLPHVLHPTHVPQMYADLPGVVRAESYPPSDGPTICANWKDTDRLYLLEDATGDCQAGCTEHDLSLFSIDDQGTVEEQTLDEDIRTVEDISGFACPEDTWPVQQ